MLNLRIHRRAGSVHTVNIVRAPPVDFDPINMGFTDNVCSRKLRKAKQHEGATMNSALRIATAAGLAASLAASTPAVAADSGLYVGAGVGYASTDIKDDSLFVAGATASTLTTDDNSTGWKLFGGYRFNKYFGAEFGYVDLGKFSATRNVTAPAVGAVSADIKASGWTLDGIGSLPIGADFSLYGRLGVIFSETKASAAASGAVVFPPGVSPDQKASEANIKMGLGAQYDISQFFVRAEWERYFSLGKSNTTGQGDINLFSVSAGIRF